MQTMGVVLDVEDRPRGPHPWSASNGTASRSHDVTVVVCVLDFSIIHIIIVVVVSDIISKIISDIVLATLIRKCNA